MTTSPSTFRRTFARTLAHNLLVVLTLAVLGACGVATQDKEGFEPTPSPNAPLTILAERDDCWTDPDDHPQMDRDPGRVVLSGGDSTHPQVIRQAMEQVYAGKDHGMRIYGFCRN